MAWTHHRFQRRHLLFSRLRGRDTPASRSRRFCQCTHAHQDRCLSTGSRMAYDRCPLAERSHSKPQDLRGRQSHKPTKRSTTSQCQPSRRSSYRKTTWARLSLSLSLFLSLALSLCSSKRCSNLRVTCPIAKPRCERVLSVGNSGPPSQKSVYLPRRSQWWRLVVVVVVVACACRRPDHA